MTGKEIADLVRRYRFTYRNEAELQDALAAMLEDADYDVEREVRISDRDRLDLMVGRVAIEVKTKGSPVNLARQLQRYAHSDLVEEIVLVTSRPQHEAFLGAEIAGKPVEVAWIGDHL